MKGAREHMATQEERLSALERSQIANNEQFTMLLGVIGEQGRDIKRLVEQGEQHTELLKAIETAIQLLAGGITSLRTELLVIKALVGTREE